MGGFRKGEEVPRGGTVFCAATLSSFDNKHKSIDTISVEKSKLHDCAVFKKKIIFSLRKYYIFSKNIFFT